ncbi:MAG: HEPN domain-containing protein, partial [Bacteroidota bacterium]
KEWFKVAQEDLSSAEFLRNKEPVPLEIICYHCQQSAEKMLKGYLAFQGEAIRKTHDLVLLNRICQSYDASFQNITNDCLNLTDYGVNVRYPFSMEIEEADMVAAIQSARQIENFVLENLGL